MLGSVRAPIPQPIFWPSGWVVFGAATVSPEASAMVKRVVQYLVLGEPAYVNW